METDDQLEGILDLIGGRTSFMMRVARARDMLGACCELLVGQPKH
jgi:hypothetical protein